MKTTVLTDPNRMSKKEFLAEADRLMSETRGFLDEARQMREKSRPVVEETERLRAILRERLLCGKE